MACCVNPVRGTNKPGSIGLPLPDVEARIVYADKGDREMASGEIGELILRAPQHMSEYWQNPVETAEVLRQHGEGGPWVHTGDLAYMDEEGYVFLVDRKKDMMKTSGFQVWPREIEEVIATHAAVAEVGVAGIPDRAKGEMVKAWVVVRAGQSLTEADLRAYCREKLAPYKIPSKIEFKPELPKTMVGKVLRRALQEQERLREPHDR
jgi:long-chain acyl-CoA synthetase